MDREKQAKEPEGKRRDVFLKGLVKIINEEDNLPSKFVKRECDRGNQNETLKNITN